MATRLMRIPLTEGSDEFIEVEIDDRNLSEELQLVSDDGSGPLNATVSLARSMTRVLPALSTILTALRSAAHAPDEIGMELGLTLGGETGIVFAKGTAEATIAVTMTWKKPQAGGDATGPNDTAG